MNVDAAVDRDSRPPHHTSCNVHAWALRHKPGRVCKMSTASSVLQMHDRNRSAVADK
jgi:hypothetical protein